MITNWFSVGQSTQLRIKAMLNIEIYYMTLRRMDVPLLVERGNQKDEEKDASSGKVINIMSVDSTKISKLGSSWYVIVQAPLQLGLGLYFLFTLLGWSSILGMAAMIITITLNNLNSKLFVKTQRQLMKARDKRVSLMNEMLQGIRQIKFFAWESNWSKQVMYARNVELGCLKAVYISQAMFMFLWQR